jgi:hypothetical protein
MKGFFCAGLAAALQVLLVAPASAQWQAGVGTGVRSVIHTEADRAGRRVVREAGWLPGVALNAAYRAGDTAWFYEADWYRHDIAYRGQTQSGVAAASTTSTGLASVRVGARRAFAGDYFVLAALDIDRWQRTIAGTASSAGLQETYRSRRLLAGAGKTWHPAAGTVSADAAVVLSEPERLQVGFSGLFDPVAFKTRAAQGIRIGTRFRPASAPWLELRSRYDWIRVRRSDDAPVSAHGQFVGTVAQPEHERQALTLTAACVF